MTPLELRAVAANLVESAAELERRYPRAALTRDLHYPALLTVLVENEATLTVEDRGCVSLVTGKLELR